MDKNAPQRTDRWLAADSQVEETFVNLFTQVFGPEKAQQLQPQYPFQDIHTRARFIDYALETAAGKFAFEIDGLQWHHPAASSLTEYEDHLMRQNSLIHQDWLVLRWTDRQVVWASETVKEELALYLERVPKFLGNDEFLPRQQGTLLEPRAHQQDALEDLQRARAMGKTMALLTHATGTGKTVIAILDAKSIGGRTLYLAHTDSLVRQTKRRFIEAWPEKPCGLYLGSKDESDYPTVAASIQKLSRSLTAFSPDAFDYIIIDEAHRASADSYRKVLEYFEPRFTLGMTATPERSDGADIIRLFQDSAHRLSLKEAIRLGHLAPIRCIRVETNIDLRRVRFNSVNYYARDLETKIHVPSRDKMIVDTYQQYVSGRRAVCFAVTVDHGKSIAQEFSSRGIPAASVSGRAPAAERENLYERFRLGELKVLCACDVLNEGWDCPEVEVLLMARPTLSKVLYLQQLGRGTRKADGKKELIVFDFIDNASRYSMPQSVHRILGRRKYRAGAYVAGTEEDMNRDEDNISRGIAPLETLDVALWSKGVREIDIFNWQELRKDMWSAGELEIELGAGDRLIANAARRGQLKADHTVPIGDRLVYFFSKGRKEEIRKAMNLPEIGPDTIRDLFMGFVREMDMSSSYKPVFLRSLLEICDKRGRAPITRVTKAFHEFYEDRHRRGLVVEKESTRMASVKELTGEEVQRVMLQMPFEKFERRKFVTYDREDLAYIMFRKDLWKRLSTEDREEVLIACKEGIERYYERFN